MRRGQPGRDLGRGLLEEETAGQRPRRWGGGAKVVVSSTAGEWSEQGEWGQMRVVMKRGHRTQGLTRQRGEAEFNLSATGKNGWFSAGECHGSGHGLFRLLGLGWALLHLSVASFPLP